MDRQTIFQTLSQFIAIESVSTDRKRFSRIQEAVKFLSALLRPLGFSVDVLGVDTAPLIVARKIVSDKAHTIGIYGHYDVQPEDPVKEWKTSPFKLTQKNGKLFGRGVADNKGHVIQNIMAVSSLIRANKLTNNITFILEGEEETGSEHFEAYVKKAADILKKADVFYVTDMGMHAKNEPQIFYALRGILYYELTVAIGERDLHSGVYGNRVLNPIHIVSQLVSDMKDLKTGKIRIPGFYKDVRTHSAKELRLLEKAKVSEQDLQKEAQTYGVISYKNNPTYLLSKIYPSFDVNGIIGGYTGEGSKTIIPKSVTVKFSLRLVERQNPEVVESLVKNYIKSNMPKGVVYTLKSFAKAAPFYTDYDNTYVKKTAKVFKRVFNHETIYNRTGGSVPAAEILQRLFKKPVILTGFTLPDDNIHAPNENFDEEMFWKGISALEKIYTASY